MKLNLQKLNVPPLYVPLLTYLVSFALWMFAFFSKVATDPMTAQLGAVAENYLPSNSLLAYLISFTLMALSSVLIAQMNNKFAFIHTRTFIPSMIYLLTTACWVGVHGNYLAYAAAFFVLLTIYLSFESYKNQLTVESHFLAFLSLGIGSLIVPDFIFLLPFLWAGYFFLKSLSFRSFMASLFGFATPWVLVFSLRYFFLEETELFVSVQQFFYTFTMFYNDGVLRLVYSVLVVIVLIVTFLQMIFNSRRENLQTQDELNFLKILTLGVALLFVFRFSKHTAFLPLAAFFLSVFTGYSFTLVKNKLNVFLFLFLLFSGVAYLLASSILSGLLSS